MRFLLLVCAGPSFEPPVTLDAETRLWIEEAEHRGMRVIGGRIQPPDDAIVFTSASTQVVRRDGPRLDVDEQVIGFDVLEWTSEDEVLDLVGRHPMAVHGSVEVRQLLDE